MCLNPINRSYVNYLGSRKSAACACGHCLECAQKYQNDWSFRLSCEAIYWKHVYFVTLTYDNDNLPLQTIADDTYLEDANAAVASLPPTKSRIAFLRNDSNKYIFNVLSGSQVGDFLPEVNKTDCQLYLKRLRESLRLKYNSFIKFFLCSEYGPNTFRPHYHLLIYSHLPVGLISSVIVDSWQLGEVKYKEIIYDHSPTGDFQNVSGYVSKYVSKPTVFESPWVNFGFVRKPFRLMSKGLGFHYVANICAQYLQRWCREYPALFKSMEYDGINDKFHIEYGNLATSSILKLDKKKYNKLASELLNNFVYLRTTKKGKQYFFHFPRFFQNFIFPLRQTKQFVYEVSTKSFHYRTVKVLDSESALYRFYKDCLLEQFDRRGIVTAEVESGSKGLSLTEGFMLASAKDRRLAADRSKKLFESFSKFYHSKLSRAD